MLFSWLRRAVDWHSDVDVHTDTNHPYLGLSKPLRFEPETAAPVTPRPIPANLPRSRGGGLVWSSVVEQIDADDDGRADPPGPIDSVDTLGRTA